MRALLLAVLFAACGAPRCPPSYDAERREWWPLPGSVQLTRADALDAPSREFLEEIVRLMQNRADVRAVRVEARSEAEARAVADILAGMGVPRATIEISIDASRRRDARVDLSLLFAREKSSRRGSSRAPSRSASR